MLTEAALHQRLSDLYFRQIFFSLAHYLDLSTKQAKTEVNENSRTVIYLILRIKIHLGPIYASFAILFTEDRQQNRVKL